MLRAFVEKTVNSVLDAETSLARFPVEAVPGLLYSGAPGVAFFLYEVARLGGDDALIDRAYRWCELGREWARRATRTDWKGFPRGFLIGEVGVAYMEALLCERRGERTGVLAAAQRIEKVSECFDDLGSGLRPNDPIAGRGGVLCALRDLNARLSSAPEYGAARDVLARAYRRAAAELTVASAAPLDIGPS